MLRSNIIGTGSYLPAHTLSNHELSKLVDTNNDWIVERTGIYSRHIATEETETTVFMGTKAAQNALEMAGLTADKLDLILVATFTPDYIMPNTACQIQAAIHATNAFCFDINAACSGFLYALQTADAYIRSGIYHSILVVGTETISRTIDWQDRSTCILFGDGAGAAILSASHTEKGFLGFLSGSDGSSGMALQLKNRPIKNPCCPTTKDQPDSFPYLSMNGQEVFQFAVRKIPEMVKSITGQNQLSPEDISHYLLHQANLRIIKSVAKRLSLPEERFPVNLSECGNTSAASIPILLDKCYRNGIIQLGSYVLLSGFGGGLTWGSALLKL